MRPVRENISPGENSLIREIRERIRERGKIPFADFMEMALYHPRWGYYVRKKKKWGRRGDYATSPGVSPLFGGLLAKQVHQMWESMGCPDPFSVVEGGAGDGRLAFAFLKKTADDYPLFHQALSYTALDRQPEAFDREALARSGLDLKVIQGRSLTDVAGECEGVILSNELLDAFPVHWMKIERGLLQEIHVTWQKDRFVPVLDEPSVPEIGAYLKHIGVPMQEGQVFTVNLEAPRWIRQAGSILKRGYLITIDYGDRAPELYAPGHPDTLVCYFQRTACGNPFDHVGEQDITAHLDFTALMNAGEKAGLQTVGFTNQFYFLMGLGIEESLRSGPDGAVSAEDILWNQSIKELIHPGGMGGTFKVLIQAKGIENIPPLLGLSFV